MVIYNATKVNTEQDNRFNYHYYFLWCSHGATLTKHDIEMKVNLFNDFNTLNFFTFNNKVLGLTFNPSGFNVNFVKYLINDPLITSTGVKSTGRNVPPILFRVTEEDSTKYTYTEAMGLWFIDYTKPNPIMTRIMTFNDILELSISKNYNITYSVIDQEIKKIINLFRRDGTMIVGNGINIGLGFLCCRSKPEQDLRLYEHIIQEIYPTLINEYTLYTQDTLKSIVKSNFVNQIKFKFRPFLFETWFKLKWENLDNIFSNYEPLALGVLHQGCGLNILTFYKLIDAAFAENKVLCLTAKGSSIFNVLQYMNYVLMGDAIDDNNIITKYYEEEYEKKVQSNMTEADVDIINNIRAKLLNVARRTTKNNYIIIRQAIYPHLVILIENMTTSMRYKDETYKVCIVKLYKDLYNPRVPGQFSHIGHTVSFYITNTRIDAIEQKVVILIDPQTRTYINVQSAEFQEYLNRGEFMYFDIIYYNHGLNGYTPNEILQNVVNSTTSFIVPFDKRIDYGGSARAGASFERYGGSKKGTEQPRSSPTGVWELSEDDNEKSVSNKTYVITNAVRPTIYKMEPTVLKNNYKIFMDFIRTNEVLLPPRSAATARRAASTRRKTARRSTATRRKTTTRRKTARRATATLHKSSPPSY